MARHSVRRPIAWLAGVLVFALASAYALGGASVFRGMRARIRAFLEPPTPAQIQTAVAVEAQRAAFDSAVRADTAHMPRSDPPASLAFILEVMTGTVGGVLVLLVASIHWSRARPEA